MPRTLPTDDAGDQFVQFRGPQTSVTVDQLGIHFGTERRNGLMAHKPLPVVDDDAADPPSDAVARTVAEALVEDVPLVSYGVACERCGDVFETVRSLQSHQQVHTDDREQDD